MNKQIVINKIIMLFVVGLFTIISHAQEVEITDQYIASENDLDQIVDNLGLEPESSQLGQILDKTAEAMGRNVDFEIMAKSELDGYDPNSNLKLDPNVQRIELGYTHRGMDEELPSSIIANPFTGNLFTKYNFLRSNHAINLPNEFSNLTKFITGYIKQYATKDAEKINGLTHEKLALQILRASFCFGNDPLMVVSKMRRETSFRRASVSPTGAVGFSQMTGDGISEIKHQLSGDSQISMANAKNTFVKAIHCFAGNVNYNYPTGNTEAVKNRLKNSWAWDIVYGQIMVKTLVSYSKASGFFANNTSGLIEAYREAFAKYNGDDNLTIGYCLKQKSVLMRNEYACSVIEHFQQMSAQWSKFNRTSRGQNIF